MSIKKIIREDLMDKRISSLVNENIFFLHKNENIKVDTYIEYLVISEKYTDYAGDRNLSKSYSIQVDVFSKGDYEYIKKKIEEVLIEKDYRFNTSFDLYEEDTKLYHLVLRFNKKINVEQV